MLAPILFYSHNGDYGEFSNFYPTPFVFKDIQFACSEQALMYGKSDDRDYRARVCRTTDPYAVKRLGRTVKLRSDWDTIKYAWMVDVLKAKFSQNTSLKATLLATGDQVIHENCSDPWWGGGPNFPNGRDLLGKALCEVRSWLREVDAA